MGFWENANVFAIESNAHARMPLDSLRPFARTVTLLLSRGYNFSLLYCNTFGTLPFFYSFAGLLMELYSTFAFLHSVLYKNYK